MTATTTTNTNNNNNGNNSSSNNDNKTVNTASCTISGGFTLSYGSRVVAPIGCYETLKTQRNPRKRQGLKDFVCWYHLFDWFFHDFSCFGTFCEKEGTPLTPRWRYWTHQLCRPPIWKPERRQPHWRCRPEASPSVVFWASNVQGKWASGNPPRAR